MGRRIYAAREAADHGNTPFGQVGPQPLCHL